MDVEIYAHINIRFLCDLPSLEDTEENRSIARIALAEATKMPVELCLAFTVDKIKVKEGE